MEAKWMICELGDYVLEAVKVKGEVVLKAYFNDGRFIGKLTAREVVDIIYRRTERKREVDDENL